MSSFLFRIRYLILFIVYFSCNICTAENLDLLKEDAKVDLNIKKNHIKVLSIDGGGIRGIIPARILQDIEEKTGKPISELFDVVIGNSTGGLISTLIVTNDNNGRPQYTAKSVQDFYFKEGPNIFKKSFFRNVYTGWGVWKPKYDRENYDKILNTYFGDKLFSEVAKPLILLSYSINKAEPHIWDSALAREDENYNFYLRDIAGATSAAPTFFEPKKIINKHNNEITYEVDGGIYANNPIALVSALIRKSNPDIPLKNITIISIGTGKMKMDPYKKLKNYGIIDWLAGADLFNIMSSINSQLATEGVELFFPSTYRLQVELSEENMGMDNADETNLKQLVKTTENYIDSNSQKIDEICKILLAP